MDFAVTVCFAVVERPRRRDLFFVGFEYEPEIGNLARTIMVTSQVMLSDVRSAVSAIEQVPKVRRDEVADFLAVLRCESAGTHPRRLTI